MATAATVLAVLFGLHILVKFTAFLLPYKRRRAALDRSYGDKLSATARSDAVLVGVVLILAGVLFAGGVSPVSFVIGLWSGATLIQVYFHQFHEPLTPDEAPQQPVGPIKLMSYAIQAHPWRPWLEIVVLTLLVLASFGSIASGAR